MGSNNCPEVGKPKVNEEGLECCEITLASCVKTTESDSFLNIGIGKTLSFVINMISKAIKKNKANIAILLGKINYDTYEALLTQIGVSIPTATLGTNGLLVLPVYTYTTIGDYTITLIGAFPLDKTFIYIGTFDKNLDQEVKAFRISNDIIRIQTFEAGVPADGILNKTPLKITKYNV